MDVTESKRLRRRFHFALLAFVAWLAAPGAWAAGPRVLFNIPAGEFSQSVIEFYAQSKIDIFYASVGSVAGVKTQAVAGELEPSEALTRMLAGTGFTFEFEDERSVLVKRTETITAPREELPAATGVPGQPQDASRRLAEIEAGPEIDPVSMQEVVVTGSHIHGLKDIVSPLIVVSEKEKKRAVYATVQDVLRTLPANYGGGPSEDYSSTANFSRGSSVNLRGLGSGATLVLVDGRRQPVSGADGDFVDVSTIPWSAVERIEVLADGASALYGSDAVAGVVNIIMRKDLSGAETQARFGAGSKGGDEALIAQLFGHQWDTGRWMLAYQYSERTSLGMANRVYSASADKRPLGGTDQRTFLSNPGNILDPMTLRPAYAIPAGQDGKFLTAAELLPGDVNLQSEYEGRDLLPTKRTHNVFLKASQAIGEHFEISVDGRYSDRDMAAQDRAYNQLLQVPATNPFFVDPFGGSPFVFVAYNFIDDLGPVASRSDTETYTTTLGLKADVGAHWQATLSGFSGTESMRWTGSNLVDFRALETALADPDPATAFNPFGSGSNTNSAATLDAIRAVQHEDATSTIRSLNLVADGPLGSLATGTPRLAVGIDARREGLARRQGFNRDLTSSEYGRSVTAAFSELSIPVGSRLDFSVAARYEAYSDFGNTFNPKIGLRWSPTESVRFRSSWGSSFRAPTLVDLYDRSADFAGLIPVAEPGSASGEPIVVLVRAGTNPNLHEERATTLTGGIDFAPATLSGLTLSSTFYVIDYEDRTWRPRPPLTTEALLAEAQWSSLVTRNPTSSAIDAICNSPVFLGSPADCLASPPTVILDGRVRNLSATVVKGVDVDAQQSLQTNYGKFEFGLSGSYLFSFEQAVTRAAPAIDIADTAGNPSSLRFRGTAAWSRHGRDNRGLSVGLAMDYLGRSRDYASPPVTRIGAATTFDTQLSYRTAPSGYWLGDIDLTLNAVNVFNADPPFVNRILGYDPANSNPFGRVISISVQKSW